eukprot:scaffold621_cov256-Chaetoceros_neogracile.AAC.11
MALFVGIQDPWKAIGFGIHATIRKVNNSSGPVRASAQRRRLMKENNFNCLLLLQVATNF